MSAPLPNILRPRLGRSGPKLTANWITQDIAAYLNAEKLTIQELALKPDMLAEMIQLIEAGTISNKIAKDLLPDLLVKGGSPKAIVEEKGLSQISDPAQIEAMIDEVLAAHPDETSRLPRWQEKAPGLLCRPNDETQRGAGRSKAHQPAAV
jgi:aspartyl-tRNA(Asn)/glutamyl-tRNA(Gln) amidotransferase subunit B